ncbi:phosphonate ABC transporter, permease protein PhnE [Tropicimonas sp. IMCC34043]|uniref:phosphonate ABC transporter, permease protein PhnE n=1 Tax=Tropicimonas sp. IMCC34043 TaxID=2248760 RepID=UPI000E221F23|nr:phosphonate ABC transporter, permease protein PhnE [Tropicimonas sp. IMCC34043]
MSRPALHRQAFPPNRGKQAILSALIVYLVYAVLALDVSMARIVTGIGNAAHFFDRMFPPNTDPSKLALIWDGMKQSLQIAILSTVVGLSLSLPIGLISARNIAPAWLGGPARVLVMICRSFHPLIVAILFVKAVGFGVLAGALALVVATVGFVAKLFAEIVEEISPKQVEAVRATGASTLSVLLIGVLPQVLPRFAGLSAYQLDSNLRNSTIVGIVGGGGIGAMLFTASQRFDYDVVLTIILIIIATIMTLEFVTARIRKILL